MKSIDPETVEITAEDIKKALQEPPSFALFRDHEHYEEMFETWSLGDVVIHRDSDLLAESNYAELMKFLEKEHPELENDWMITHCGNWAVGWVDHLSFRALDEDKKPTLIFKLLKQWFKNLSDYPIANEEDYSEREHAATWSNVVEVGKRFIKENPPEDWEMQVFNWFDVNNQSAIESDGNGGYPDDDEMKDCLQSLDLLHEDYMEEEESDEEETEGTTTD